MIKSLKMLAALAVLAMPIAAHAAIEIGAPAPEITATDITGTPFKLSDHKGKIVVLEWTNAQCPFVVKHYETGNMQKTQQDVRALGDVEWVSINSSAPGKQGHVTAEKAAQVIIDEGAHPSVKLLDPSGEIGHLYGAKTTPHMFVIDAAGNLAYMGAIDDNSSPRQSAVEGATNHVLAAVNDLKAGHSVAVSSTQPYGCSVKY